ncbi:hypothetical protein FACS189472_17090 [Alphaproteobacteria bacterium]|nr:hypothetical protein FACS189472_17090 [Alphaproteobacteria bacterium]
MVPSTRFVYLGLEWNTVTMTVKKTTEKNTTLKNSVKRWIKLTKAGAEVRVRDIAKLIGQLSATRPQHEEASLYLASLNRRKCEAVHSGGWNITTRLTQALLPEMYWWLRQLRQNTPNSIRPFEAVVVLYTDASETGWGATARRYRTKPRWMYGWWNGEGVQNCLRELYAVILAVKEATGKGRVKEEIGLENEASNEGLSEMGEI